MTLIFRVISISNRVFSQEGLNCPGLLDQLVRLVSRVPRDGGVHAGGHQGRPAPARGHTSPHRIPFKALSPSNGGCYKTWNNQHRQINLALIQSISSFIYTAVSVSCSTDSWKLKGWINKTQIQIKLNLYNWVFYSVSKGRYFPAWVTFATVPSYTHLL